MSLVNGKKERYGRCKKCNGDMDINVRNKDGELINIFRPCPYCVVIDRDEYPTMTKNCKKCSRDMDINGYGELVCPLCVTMDKEEGERRFSAFEQCDDLSKFNSEILLYICRLLRTQNETNLKILSRLEWIEENTKS